jgi:hypothetical protein
VYIFYIAGAILITVVLRLFKLRAATQRQAQPLLEEERGTSRAVSSRLQRFVGPLFGS